MKTQENYNFRLVLIGDESTGKTAIVVRYLTGRFINDYESGMDVAYSHHIMMNQESIAMHILDTSGLKTSQASVAWADSIIVTYSIDSRKSFRKANELLKEVQETNKREASLVLVGTKSDLWSHRTVLKCEGEQLAKHYQSSHFEVSASQDYAAIKRIFSVITRQVLNTRDKGKNKTPVIFRKLLNSV